MRKSIEIYKTCKPKQWKAHCRYCFVSNKVRNVLSKAVQNRPTERITKLFLRKRCAYKLIASENLLQSKMSDPTRRSMPQVRLPLFVAFNFSRFRMGWNCIRSPLSQILFCLMEIVLVNYFQSQFHILKLYCHQLSEKKHVSETQIGSFLRIYWKG